MTHETSPIDIEAEWVETASIIQGAQSISSVKHLTSFWTVRPTKTLELVDETS